MNISVFKNIYEYQKIFRDLENRSEKCFHLKCDIEYNINILNERFHFDSYIE